MKSKTILGADGATKMRQITVGIHGKGGEAGIRVVQEQQETIEKQSRLIADLIATLESWEQTAGYDGEELKERAKDLQLRERQDL